MNVTKLTGTRLVYATVETMWLHEVYQARPSLTLKKSGRGSSRCY